MNLNRRDLKKIIYDFNSISNRFMKVDVDEYLIILKKFINFIESKEIIFDYIKDCGNPTYDVAEEIDSVSKSYGREYFDLGETEKEEVSNIYHILKCILENNIKICFGLAVGYANGTTKYQDRIKGFNERVVLVLIRYIEGYLTKIGIDMGLDETVKYSIAVNNGQVNLASDNATINSTQNNGVNQAELKDLINMIVSHLPEGINKEDKEAVSDSLEVIQTELSNDKPKKSLIRTALNTLKGVQGAVELTNSILTLTTFIQPLI